MASETIDIGLPVFNGADTVARAIESVRAQTHREFRLLVSDNSSTDDTRAVVERHAAEDSRVVLISQPSNVGPYENFASLIHRAEAPYFAFVAADDWWSPSFLEATLVALVDDPEATCCVPRTAFYDIAGTRLHVTPSTYSLTDPKPTDRVRRFLVHPSDCSRFYGLHRREAFAAAFDGEALFHAGDWYIVLLELMAGTHLEVPHVLLHRQAANDEKYVRHWRKESRSLLRARTPLLPLRRALKRKLAKADWRAIRFALARLDARLDREHRSVEKRAGAAVRE